MREKILITGANGYIGRQLVMKALDAGYDINVLVRNPSLFVENNRIKAFQYDFSSVPSQEAFEGVNAVVHLAAMTHSLPSKSERVEVEAARRLIEVVNSSGVRRIIFISSQAAQEDAPTTYGRIKWEIEQEILAVNGLVARPGQVYGGQERGLFGVLVNTVRKLPVLPRFVPDPMVQPIHVDDLAAGLLKMVENKHLASGVYCLASNGSITFSDFLSSIAKYRVRSFRLFVPVPTFFISLATAVLGRVLSSKFGLDRLQSLFDLQPMETAADIERLNLLLRTFQAGMHLSGDDRQRRLLIEANALFRYILKRKPGSALLRRYVHAVVQTRDGSPLNLHGAFLKVPVLLSLLDDRIWSHEPNGKELAWRLNAAMLLAEATMEGSSVFLGLGRRTGPLINLFVVARAIVSELLWRIVKVLSYPLVSRAMRKKRDEK